MSKEKTVVLTVKFGKVWVEIDSASRSRKELKTRADYEHFAAKAERTGWLMMKSSSIDFPEEDGMTREAVLEIVGEGW